MITCVFEDGGKGTLRHVVVHGIVEKDGKLLMVQEGREDVKGKWNLPAGHADFGESPVDAAAREAKEETGLDVIPLSLMGIYAFHDQEGRLVLRFNIKCEVKGGSFEEQEGEILDIKWMSKQELEALKAEGKLRSERTWWPIQDWIEGKKYPLNIVRVVGKTF